MADEILHRHRGICENCLFFGDGIVDYPFGPRRGTVKDPIRDSLSLCPECVKCFEHHDLKELGSRYRDHRPPLPDKDKKPPALAPGPTKP